MRTPQGVSDRLPNEVKRLITIKDRLQSVFDANAYMPIKTPVIEYFDTLKNGLPPGLSDKAVKFFNAHGELVMLKPDHTTPIARVVATRMQADPKPIRLYYIDPIFRSQAPGQFADVEILQAGVECVGAPAIEADVEIIRLAIECVRKLGIRNFQIDIGHTDFLRGLSERQIDQLRKGDFNAFGSIPTRGKSEVAKESHELQKLDQQLQKENLAEPVFYNKGLVKEMGYYTGLMIDILVQGIGTPIGGGGRYDTLISEFGYECPAIGFALNLNIIPSLANLDPQ